MTYDSSKIKEAISFDDKHVAKSSMLFLCLRTFLELIIFKYSIKTTKLFSQLAFVKRKIEIWSSSFTSVSVKIVQLLEHISKGEGVQVTYKLDR